MEAENIFSMDAEDFGNVDHVWFRKHGKEMVDYIADYLENIRDRRVLPEVQPGYLHKLIPTHAPEEGEKWEDVSKDIERVIMPGMTHWHHPNFHAYFAAANSYPAILGDMLTSGITCIGFSWIAGPACTELEVVVMDWLAQMLKLPEEFMSSSGKGGGVIQGTGCEATLVSLLSAKNKMLDKLKEQNPDFDEGQVLSKLVCYISDQAHSSVKKACLLGHVICHQVVSNAEEAMTGQGVDKAMKEDRQKGLIPFMVIATLGTTSTCAYDRIKEIGPIVRREGLWMHIDAAYAGSAFICPEFRHLLDGVEYADTFDFNPHKWLLMNINCSAMWIKDTNYLEKAFNVDPLYLKHDYQGKVPDLRHWQIPLSRRFRALKVWFVLRMYGVKNLQEYIRKHVRLAHQFEDLMKVDDRFEITHEVTMGLVCFRLKNQTNEVNQQLLRALNEDGRIHLVPSASKGVYFLRFAVCALKTEPRDIQFAFDTISELSTQILSNKESKKASLTELAHSLINNVSL